MPLTYGAAAPDWQAGSQEPWAPEVTVGPIHPAKEEPLGSLSSHNSRVLEGVE